MMTQMEPRDYELRRKDCHMPIPVRTIAAISASACRAQAYNKSPAGRPAGLTLGEFGSPNMLAMKNRA
jgi:hypothetical protein